MTEMISKLFFASFRTPFSVLFYDAQEPRWTGGGVFKHPHSRWWKIQRPIRARVKSRIVKVWGASAGRHLLSAKIEACGIPPHTLAGVNTSFSLIVKVRFLVM